MKRWVKTLLIVLLVLALLVTGLYIWQRKNIALLRAASRQTQEELDNQIAEHQQQMQEMLDSHTEITVRDLTDEEKDALREGTLSTEDLIGRLTETNTAEPVAEPSQPPAAESTETTPPPPPPPPAESTYEQQLSALVAQVYILRESFQNQLAQIEAEAKAEYHALPEEQRAKSALADLAWGYYDRMKAMEAECDASMTKIVDEMRTLIAENHGDETLPDSVWASYLKEKELKKTWYLSQLEQRGL